MGTINVIRTCYIRYIVTVMWPKSVVTSLLLINPPSESHSGSSGYFLSTAFLLLCIRTYYSFGIICFAHYITEKYLISHPALENPLDIVHYIVPPWHTIIWVTLNLVLHTISPNLIECELGIGHPRFRGIARFQSPSTLREFQPGCLWLFHSWNRSTAQCFSSERSTVPYNKGFKPWEKRPVWGRLPASLCHFRVRSNSPR